MNMTDEVERLLLDTVKALFASDADVPGLLDLPIAQLRALNLLGREGADREPTMGDLADSLGVALSTATQLVERIEKRGLARREHSDPHDRRVVRLALTDEGRRLLADRRRLRRARLDAALSPLTPAQRGDLAAALAPLAAAARALDRDPAPPESALPRVLLEVR